MAEPSHPVFYNVNTLSFVVATANPKSPKKIETAPAPRNKDATPQATSAKPASFCFKKYLLSSLRSASSLAFLIAFCLASSFRIAFAFSVSSTANLAFLDSPPNHPPKAQILQY